MPMPMHYYPEMTGATSGWMIVWMIVSALFWLGLAAVIVWALVRLASRFGRGPRTGGMGGMGGQPSATDIVRARYARGEIDAATYREMLEQLTAPDAPTTPARSV